MRVRQILFVALMFPLALLPCSNHAYADVAFLFDGTVGDLGDGLHSGDQISQDGITMSFANVMVASGGAGEVTGVGILMSGATDPTFDDVIQFDFSFDQNVVLNTYQLGTWEDVPVGSFFTVAGNGDLSGNNVIPDGTSFTESTFGFAAGDIDLFEAGVLYTFSHNLPAAGDPLFFLEEFNVSAVPEPCTAVLAVVGITGLLNRRRRK